MDSEIRRWMRRCALGLVAATLLGAAGAHAATPTAADKETARKLMTEGRTARKDGDLKTALARFRAAHDIMHVPTTGVELAKAQMAVGQLVEARDTILQVARYPRDKHEPAPFTKAREEAGQLDDQLKPRIPSLVVRAKVSPDGAPLELQIDGEPIPRSALDAPRSVNPGHHVVLVKSGDTEARAELDVKEGETKDVPLEIQASVAPAASASASSVASAAPIATPSATAPPVLPTPVAHPTSRSGPGAGPTLLIAGIATTGVGLLLGSISGGLSWSKKSSAEKSCVDSRCPPKTHDDIDMANTFATLSNVGFIVAGVGAGLTVTGLIIGSPKSESSSTGARVRPWVGATSAGVRGEF